MKLKMVAYKAPATTGMILRTENLAEEPGYTLMSACQHGDSIIACWAEEREGESSGIDVAASLAEVARHLGRLANAAEEELTRQAEERREARP